MNWIILLPPLAAAVVIALFLHPKRLWSVGVSIAACAISFVGSVLLAVAPDLLPVCSWMWLNLPGLRVSIGAETDTLATLMLLVVTGVALCIHLFAFGYMREDAGLSRFFAKLSLFMFSMLGIVLANNLVMMFIFWELVGLSSYLLIGFWFDRPSAAAAAKKAFIVNRIGDFGFLLGILGVWWIWGSVEFAHLRLAVDTLGANVGVSLDILNWVALGLFMGCVGKSAMVPLHVWLPDAMEGPTPVSALIHAATMVAAGVYMLCRVFFILELSPVALQIIAWVGIGTALFAALIATQQNDIKRVLAYSTLSQLGYMVAAVGLAATTAAMFHLATHAFFKALLFLAAGSVIHALHHQQDMWRMGGLWKRMPVTSWTFLIGAAALGGVPLLSGFFSKEAILLAAFHANKAVFVIGLLTAALTAFYMTRLFLVAFLGKEREPDAAHAHESPRVMTVPLTVLAALSIIGGKIGLDTYLTGDHSNHGSHDGAWLVMGLSIAMLAVGVFAGWRLYRKAENEPLRLTILARKFYVDEIYEAVILRGQRIGAAALDWFDQWIIGGLIVRGLAAMGTLGGEVLRLIQSGNLHGYVFLFVVGVLFLCYWVLFLPFMR